MLTLSALLGGCAAWSRHASTEDHLAFLSQALDADAKAREGLWRNANGAEAYASGDAQLRIALLQSLPNHSGTDMAAARARLDALASKNPASLAVTSVARVRLAQMSETSECHDEVMELKQRLARVVEIERRMNKGNK